MDNRWIDNRRIDDRRIDDRLKTLKNLIMSDFKRHNFKKLKIWQMGIEIAKDISDITASFPSFENFGMRGQMDRCSV